MKPEAGGAPPASPSNDGRLLDSRLASDPVHQIVRTMWVGLIDLRGLP
jgi:hypothetical protein